MLHLWGDTFLCGDEKVYKVLCDAVLFLSSSFHSRLIKIPSLNTCFKSASNLRNHLDIETLNIMFSSIKAAAVLAFISVASAAPTARQAPNYPPTSLSDNFRLVAKVTSADQTFNDYVLTSYHTGAGTAYAVLVPNVTVTDGRIFYLTGTAEEAFYHNDDILPDSGSDPMFPSGVIINTDGSVSINAGLGQPGIG